MLPDELIDVILGHADERILDQFPDKTDLREYVIKNSCVIIRHESIIIETPTRFYFLNTNPYLLLTRTFTKSDDTLNMYNIYTYLKLKNMNPDVIPFKDIKQIPPDVVVNIDGVVYGYSIYYNTYYKIANCQWIVYNAFCADGKVYIGDRYEYLDTDMETLLKLFPKFNPNNVKFVNKDCIVFKNELNVLYDINTGVPTIYPDDVVNVNGTDIQFRNGHRIKSMDKRRMDKTLYIDTDGFIRTGQGIIYHNINIFKHPSTWDLFKHDY